MKYMTFNSSCAFAGVANMLESFGIDKEDRELAIGMKLPYLFDETYRTGASLQSAEHFNLYLNQLGITMQEEQLPKHEMIKTLKHSTRPMMIGINLEFGKHAIIFKNYQNGHFCFTNNKRFDSEKPAEYRFTEAELSDRLDETTVVGWLEDAPIKDVDFTPFFEKSLFNLQKYRVELLAFCDIEQSVENLNAARDPLFRPIALDGLVIMELVENEKMVAMQQEIQTKLLAMLRKQEPVIPKQELPMDLIANVLDEYVVLIKEQLGAI